MFAEHGGSSSFTPTLESISVRICRSTDGFQLQLNQHPGFDFCRFIYLWGVNNMRPTCSEKELLYFLDMRFLMVSLTDLTFFPREMRDVVGDFTTSL